MCSGTKATSLCKLLAFLASTWSVSAQSGSDLVFAGGLTDWLCQSDGSSYSCSEVSDVSQGSLDVAAADLDGDGDADLAFANLFVNTTTFDPVPDRVCLNDGDGVFTCSVLPGEARFSRSVVTTDLDGDGDADLAFANSDGGNRVCFNDGAGTFTCVDVAEEPEPSLDVAAADLDGDGDMDLVFAELNGPGGYDRLCLHDGSGSFDCSYVTDDQDASGVSSDGVAAADLDGDGDADVAFANNEDQSNRVCLNDGGGAFDCSPVSDGLYDSVDVEAADLDGDGDVDLAFANDDGENRACLNDGGGAFTCSDISGDADDTSGMAAGDLDGDGDVDLAFAVEFGMSETCLNDGAGTFVCSDVPSDVSVSNGVAIGDFGAEGGVPSAPPPPSAQLFLEPPYPNPSGGAVTVRFTAGQTGPIYATLYDSFGREIQTLFEGVMRKGAVGSVRVGSGDILGGVYFVRLVSGEESVARRITLVR